MMFRMKNTMKSEFIGLLMTMSFLLGSCLEECPRRDEAIQVDPEKLSGEWFVVSAFRPKEQPPSKCGRVYVYSIPPNTVHMNYDVINIRTNKRSAFYINATIDADFTGSWKITTPISKTLGTFQHRVIALNYNSDLLMIGCDDSSAFKFMMIWSRKRIVSFESPYWAETKDIAASYVDRERIIEIDQTNCPEPLDEC